MCRAFTIMEAKEGGYVVLSNSLESHITREFLFAGTIDECLQFVATELRKPRV